MRAESVPAVMVEHLESRRLLSVATGWSSRGPGGGGAFFAPSFGPYHANELFVASDMSGLYHSSDLGHSWALTDFRQIQGNRQSQVQYTSDPAILYALDFTSLANGVDTARPSRSTDGGAHWAPLNGWDPSNLGVYFYADPNSTQNLLVTDYNHLYYSTDGGASFNLKYTAPVNTGLYIGGAFFDGSNIYLGTNQGLLVSSNGGGTFTVSAATGVPAGQGIFSLAGAKQGATTRLYAVTVPIGDLYSGVTVEEVAQDYQSIYTMDVGLTNWIAKTTGIAASDKPNFISAPRGDINTVYVAGASTGGVPSIYRSSNGAGSWSRVLNTTGNSNVITGWQGTGGDSGWGFGELVMSFEVSPTNPNVAAFTDFGYIHLTTDGGATWQQAYVNTADQNPAGANTPQHKPYHGIGLEDTSALWLNWTDANHLFAGYTDITGVRSADGGNSWSFPTYNPRQNTIYNVAASVSGSTLYAASSSVHDLYQSTYLTDGRIDGGTGRVLYSADSGTTWNTLHDFANPVIWVATDPTDANRMYASVVDSLQGGIFTTTNLGVGAASVWTKVTNPPRTEGHPFNIRVLNDGALVVSYSGRRTSGFTNSSGVFFSSDHGQTWSDRTDTVGSGMKYYTKDITIDPTDLSQNTWWAAVRSGWGGNGNGQGGLYKTTDRGLRWARVFSTDSVESVTINPSTREMYIATLASGLWYSPDATAANLSFSQTSYPFRQPERIFLNPYNLNEVWVASFGYGLAVGTGTAPPTVNAAAFDYVKKPNELRITFSTNLSTTFSAVNLLVKNLDTNLTYAPTVNYPAGTIATLTFPTAPNGVLPDGNYRLTITASGVTDPSTNLTLDGNADGMPGGDYAFDFFALAGDANHDRAVDIRDLSILATHWLQSGRIFSDGDFNYDSVVDAKDLGILSGRWQKRLAPPVNTLPASLVRRPTRTPGRIDAAALLGASR